MKPIGSVTTILAAGAMAAGQAVAEDSPRPAPMNFVFILADDLGYSDLGCYGNPSHETPYLDKLAKSGMRFTRAYAACAVCSPTRASVMTGKYPVRLGITDWIPHPGAKIENHPLVLHPTKSHLSLSEVTMAEYLGERGYQTAYVGKWHLGESSEFWPQAQGFGTNRGGCQAGQPPNGYFAPYKIPTLDDGPSGEYLPERLAEESIRALEEFAKTPDRPFLLFYGEYLVHAPYQAQEDRKKYFSEKLKTMPDCPWKNATYAAMVSALDDAVGRVLDKLDELKLSDRTVVVFFSDNGGVDYGSVTTNRPLRGGKGRYYEGGVREPMIVRWPGVTRAGSTCDVPVASMDFFPTFAAISGHPVAEGAGLDGRDITALLRGGNTAVRDAMFWHYPHYHGSGATPCSTVLMEEYKLIRFYETGRRELYNLRKDPGEKKDMAAAEPDRVRKMEARLDAWLKETGAYIPVLKKVSP